MDTTVNSCINCLGPIFYKNKHWIHSFTNESSCKLSDRPGLFAVPHPDRVDETLTKHWPDTDKKDYLFTVTPGDQEIEVIQVLTQLMEQCPPDARNRVLGWALERYKT